MDHSFAKIMGSPEDYRVCTNCGCPNWYENEECVNGCVYSELINYTLGVLNFIESEYDFYEEEGYLEEEIDNFTRSV